MKTIATFLLASAILFACEETVELDIRQTPTKVVIEGLVTNQVGRQYVRLTRSASFYESGPTPRVSHAQVTVTDDLGQVVPFVHNPRNYPDSIGYYVPQSPFTGSIGRSYTLTVRVDEHVYSAVDRMSPAMELDSLVPAADPRPSERDMKKGRTFQVLVFGKEPGTTKDYYLINVYRNDTLVYEPRRGAFTVDDQTLSEKIQGVPAPVNFRPHDRAVVECLSLSREAFQYYEGLAKLTTGSGGMFDSPPSNPPSNLSNGALGFFQASAVTRVATMVEH
ncbi:MAG: DUF4249 domain-containing protein [Cyclobacteriaceae bacterium]|nr:DUF4249 domain-containing protein [Cyclobacteriaceae bacterium]